MYLQSWLWSTWCRLQLQSCPCALTTLSSPAPLPLFCSHHPLNESGTAVTADVIAKRLHRCYDNKTSSLSRSFTGPFRACHGMFRNYASQYKTATFQPLLPQRWRERFSRFLLLQVLFLTTPIRDGGRFSFFEAKCGKVHSSCRWLNWETQAGIWQLLILLVFGTWQGCNLV